MTITTKAVDMGSGNTLTMAVSKEVTSKFFGWLLRILGKAFSLCQWIGYMLVLLLAPPDCSFTVL
jgi:hypothetical protein